MDDQVISNCNKRAKYLCGKCQICIDRSIFSHPKGKQYSSQNELDSKFVTQGSSKLLLWDCIYCFHTFSCIPTNFLKSKNGCIYCANQKLCPKDKNCIDCFNKSFASSKRASNVVDKSIDLTQIVKNKPEQCKFLCECGHEFSSLYNSVSQGTWCPYCANLKLCHKDKNCKSCFNKSFASSERAHNVGDKSIDLTQIFLGTGKRCNFLCECGHEFSSTYKHITQDHWCPYCANKKLCPKDKNCKSCFNKSFASSERAHNVVDKNIDLTQIFLYSSKKCKFICDEKHPSWISTCGHITQGQWCPYCINKTEAAILDWFRNIFDLIIIPQKKFDWCRSDKGNMLPFDMVIPELMLVLECDGRQHFENVKQFHSEFKTIVKNDVYKMKCAMKHGYTILRIDQRGVWNDTFDWKTKLFNAIKLYSTPRMRRIVKDKSIYTLHRKLLD